MDHRQLVYWIAYWVLVCNFTADSCLSCRHDKPRQSSSDTNRIMPIHPETYFTPSQVLAYRGYPSETHHVLTQDGYILTLHRIPPAVGGRKVVFLQHGTAQSSGTWLVNPKNTSLACLLSDRGYDVWMGNSRGNRYSRAHVQLDPQGAEFWRFSWDQYGQYDIPAIINYILEKTGQSKLSYVGHSMGGPKFFVAMIKHPELNAKIDLMVGLAVQSAFGHPRDWLKLFKRFYRIGQLVHTLARTRAYLDNQGLPRELMRLACEQTYVQAAACLAIINSVAGWDLRNTDLNLMPVMNSNIAMGTSVRNFAQLAQNYLAGEVFQAYDYGPAGNLLRYGSSKPFQYNLTQVTAPVYVFWGSADAIITSQDVHWMIKRLGNLQGATVIHGYNHMDFLWGKDAKLKCYDKIFALLPPPDAKQ